MAVGFRLERWPGGTCTHWKSAAFTTAHTQIGHSFGRVFDAPSALSEVPDLDCRLTLSINTQVCYRLRSLGATIWEIPVRRTPAIVPGRGSTRHVCYPR